MTRKPKNYDSKTRIDICAWCEQGDHGQHSENFCGCGVCWNPPKSTEKLSPVEEMMRNMWGKRILEDIFFKPSPKKSKRSPKRVKQ